MAKKASLTELMAEEMKKTTLESLASILKQEGLEKALQRRRELNDTYSENDWWPPVARAMRLLLDDYIREQEEEKRKQEEARQRQERDTLQQQLVIQEAARAAGGNATIIIGGNLTGSQQQWKADQVIGLNEGDVVRNKKTGN